MGVCQSAEVREQHQRDAQISKGIREEKMGANRKIKLLLLGAGESGKSTILKQMQILHTKGFSPEQLVEMAPLVYANVIQSLGAIIEAMKRFDIALEDPQLEEDCATIMRVLELQDERMPLTQHSYTSAKRLWADKGVQECFGRRIEFQINDSAAYFLDNLDRIHQPNYKPTEADALRIRVATMGVVEVCFQFKQNEFRVFDVGGQKSERKKWIHCFDQVNAVIFIVAISEYDKNLREDETVNRMIDSMALFDSICNLEFFFETTFILFFNKKDLFLEKVGKVSIKVAYPDYEGPKTYDACVAYIRQQFLALNQNSERIITVHETCATDTNQVQLVIQDVIDSIIEKKLHATGVV